MNCWLFVDQPELDVYWWAFTIAPVLVKGTLNYGFFSHAAKAFSVGFYALLQHFREDQFCLAGQRPKRTSYILNKHKNNYRRLLPS